jgi:hypothetical protein
VLFFNSNSLRANSDLKCAGLHFGRFFSQTHPVTLFWIVFRRARVASSERAFSATSFLKSYPSCHRQFGKGLNFLPLKDPFPNGWHTLTVIGLVELWSIHYFFPTGIVAHAFVLPQPEWLMQVEITNSSTYVCRLSATLLSNKNQRGFHTIVRLSEGQAYLKHSFYKQSKDCLPRYIVS